MPRLTVPVADAMNEREVYQGPCPIRLHQAPALPPAWRRRSIRRFSPQYSRAHYAGHRASP
jgi:hypothetical protein